MQFATVAKRGIFAYISNELQADAVVPVTDMLAAEMGHAFALQEDREFILGDGTSTYGREVGLNNAIGSAGVFTNTTDDHDAWAELTLSDFYGTMSLIPDKFRVDGQLAWLCSAAFKWQVMDRLTAAVNGAGTTVVVDGQPRAMFLGYLTCAEWMNDYGRCRQWSAGLQDDLHHGRSYTVLDRQAGMVYTIDPGQQIESWRDALDMGVPVHRAKTFTPPMAGDYIDDLDSRTVYGGLIVASLYCGLYVAEEVVMEKEHDGDLRFFVLGADLVPLRGDQAYYLSLADAMQAAAKLEVERERFKIYPRDFAETPATVLTV
ncbi:phage major capsid family protein [Aeoliella sp. SH292]|uniref:phage major capsid family protein n=1 Tax=Aeoliella sp. SH292 TaxID=3454464 RepID=UPI003F982317